PPLKMGFASSTVRAPETVRMPEAAPAETAHHAPRTTDHGPPTPRPGSESRVSSSEPPTPLLRVPLRLVGVVGRLYAVLESDRGLVLLDQHAAHERILFEQMLERLER